MLAVGAIEEETFSIEICELAGEWNSPEFGAWTAPPLEDGRFVNGTFSSASLVNVDFFSVVNANVVCVIKFAGAEEQGALQGWYHVDCARGLAECVL